MFKSARWKSDKNKVKVVFKLQFHAAKVPPVGDDALMISVVPAETGKATVKSNKAEVRDGSCLWEDPVCETVKFSRDPKLGKIHEKIYYFVVGTGLSKSGVIGEVSIDLSKYALATKVSLVSLPLKNSKAETVLHVSIQRMQESNDQRMAEDHENGYSNCKDNSLRSQLSNDDIDGIVESNSDAQVSTSNGTRRASSGSDLTISSSGSSSGVEIAWQPHVKSNSFHHGSNFDAKNALHEESRRSQWEWLGSSVLEASTDDSLSTPRENFVGQQLEEASDIVLEKLKSELSALSRQVEMSELEVQTLRKQIMRESKRGQDLFREVVCFKEERDSLRLECEKLKASERRMNEAKNRTSLGLEGGDYKAIVEELRQELNHEKELNSNLRLQLQKTQESNSELILAVQDLDDMLEQKNRVITNLKNGEDVDEQLHEVVSTHPPYHESEDEEQKALEELVKEHGDAKDAYLLEQQVMDMHSELEIYKRDKDELEMQMEQLALDYEIMKQENHEMAYKLQQSQLQEQLKMPYEWPSSYAGTQELEGQIAKLEDKLKLQSSESEDSSRKIMELEAHVKIFQEKLQKQAKGFEADLEALMRCKVEQEQRAIRAEEALRKTRLHNANTAERLQEEFRRLSMQMGSTFEANETVATKALAEANELRLQKICLEEMIKKASEEQQSIKDHYEARLEQLVGQASSMKNEIRKMQSEIEGRELQLEQQKRDGEETKGLLSDEILRLEKEKVALMNELEQQKRDGEETKGLLSDEILRLEKEKVALLNELEQVRIHMKDMEDRESNGTIELEKKIMLVESDAQASRKELNGMRCLVEEKESVVVNLLSELDSLRSQCEELRHFLAEDELEKEYLKKQVAQIKSELKKKDDTLSSMEKKIKDGIGRGTDIDAVKATSKTSKSVPRGPKDIANLKERIKLLEGDIKLKESALETSSKAFLEKEKDLLWKIEELEGRLDVLSQSNTNCCENAVEKAAVSQDASSDEVRNSHQDSNITNGHIELQEMPGVSVGSHGNLDDQTKELTQVKERNKFMEAELKEMQERYSSISLKFAEVEGERQQLVMKLRNLKNAQKAS